MTNLCQNTYVCDTFYEAKVNKFKKLKSGGPIMSGEMGAWHTVPGPK